MSLSAILRSTKERVKRLQGCGVSTSARVPNDFVAALKAKHPAVIAEIKLASPSLGPIAPHADPVRVAGEYLRAGAAALSVLTEPDFFRGSAAHLRQVRRAFPEAAILRKDFIIDERQLFETVEMGADACLLIVSILSDCELLHLYNRALALKLCPLVEIHSEAELERARKMAPEVIGINNRDLSTLETSLSTCRGISLGNEFYIAESGIETGVAVAELSALGYRGFLIGSSLMASPENRLRALLADARVSR